MSKYKFNKQSKTAFLEQVQTALCWVRDNLEGDFIESDTYKKDYLGFDYISQDDLDLICKILNAVLNRLDAKFGVTNSAGEIIKLPRRQRKI